MASKKNAWKSFTQYFKNELVTLSGSNILQTSKKLEKQEIPKMLL